MARDSKAEGDILKFIRYLFLVIIFSAILSGCSLGEPTIKLTEDESNAIAQYCAHLIMKYGAKDYYNQKLLDEKDYGDALVEREALLNPSPTPTPSPVPDEVKPTPTPEITGEPDSGGEGDPGNPGNETTPEPPANVVSASEMFDQSVFEVSLVGYEMTRNYKNELEYFTLSAPEGKLVAAFTLEVKNITSQNKVFDYNNYDAQFQLVIDSGTAVGPEISLLSNDFRFTRSEIKPGESFKGVVVFFIDDKCKEFTFRIIGGSKAYEYNNSAEVENGN